MKHLTTIVLTLTYYSSIVLQQPAFAQWVKQQSNFNPPSRIASVSAVDTSVVWAVSDGIYSGNTSRPKIQFIRTLDGGSTWVLEEVDSSSIDEQALDIHAFDKNIAWILSYNSKKEPGNDRFRIYRTTDGGS